MELTDQCRFRDLSRHVCLDRNGNPTEGTSKVCWYEARLQVFEMADALAGVDTTRAQLDVYREVTD